MTWREATLVLKQKKKINKFSNFIRIKWKRREKKKIAFEKILPTRLQRFYDTHILTQRHYIYSNPVYVSINFMQIYDNANKLKRETNTFELGIGFMLLLSTQSESFLFCFVSLRKVYETYAINDNSTSA